MAVKRIQLRTPTRADLLVLAQQLRLADQNELAVTHPGVAVFEVLRQSVNQSRGFFCYVADYAGQPSGLFGMTSDSLLSDVGHPWFLSTDAFYENQKTVTRIAAWAVSMMCAHKPILRNVVDCRNTTTIQWLEALGFTMQSVVERVPGYPLFLFELRTNEKRIIASKRPGCIEDCTRTAYTTEFMER